MLYGTLTEYSYLIIFAFILIESSPIGFLAPGVIVLVLAGFLAGIGELNILYVIIVSIFAAMVGDSLGFCLGKYGVVKLQFLHRYFTKLQYIHNKVVKHKNIIIFGHLAGYTRSVIPLLLGITKFPFLEWFWRNVLGAMIFVALYSGIGFVIGFTTQNLGYALSASDYLQWLILILLGIWIVSVIFLYKKGKISP
jgi:membrane protein DedA with SNARE-associated domain